MQTGEIICIGFVFENRPAEVETRARTRKNAEKNRFWISASIWRRRFVWNSVKFFDFEYITHRILIECEIFEYQAGGREASGVLKGYDPLLNLVLDNTQEYLRDTEEPYKMCDDTRSLGLVVCRGTSVVLICPQDGMESIQNPFITQDA